MKRLIAILIPATPSIVTEMVCRFHGLGEISRDDGGKTGVLNVWRWDEHISFHERILRAVKSSEHHRKLAVRENVRPTRAP